MLAAGLFLSCLLFPVCKSKFLIFSEVASFFFIRFRIIEMWEGRRESFFAIMVLWVGFAGIANGLDLAWWLFINLLLLF